MANNNQHCSVREAGGRDALALDLAELVLRLSTLGDGVCPAGSYPVAEGSSPARLPRLEGSTKPSNPRREVGLLHKKNLSNIRT